MTAPSLSVASLTFAPAAPRPIMWPTSSPWAMRWSAMIRRWHRHHTASEHMIAVGVSAAFTRSCESASENSSPSAWSA